MAKSKSKPAIKPVTKKVPPSKLVPYEITITSDSIGLGRGQIRTLQSEPLQCIFRVERAEPVDGIDYSAFAIGWPFVANKPQWGSMPYERPATEFLKEVRRRDDLPQGDIRRAYNVITFDACSPVQSVAITVTNKSEKQLPFAIKLVGQAIE